MARCPSAGHRAGRQWRSQGPGRSRAGRRIRRARQAGARGRRDLQANTGSGARSAPAPGRRRGASPRPTASQGRGTDILYQDVTIPAGSTARLSMLVGYVNQAGGFATPDTLDFHTFPMLEQLRIDVVDPGSDLLSTDAGDVLLNVFQTRSGTPRPAAQRGGRRPLGVRGPGRRGCGSRSAHNQSYSDAAVDAVSIQTQPITSPPPTASERRRRARGAPAAGLRRSSSGPPAGRAAKKATRLRAPASPTTPTGAAVGARRQPGPPPTVDRVRGNRHGPPDRSNHRGRSRATAS